MRGTVKKLPMWLLHGMIMAFTVAMRERTDRGVWKSLEQRQKWTGHGQG